MAALNVAYPVGRTCQWSNWSPQFEHLVCTNADADQDIAAACPRCQGCQDYVREPGADDFLEIPVFFRRQTE